MYQTMTKTAAITVQVMSQSESVYVLGISALSQSPFPSVGREIVLSKLYFLIFNNFYVLLNYTQDEVCSLSRPAVCVIHVILCRAL